MGNNIIKKTIVKISQVVVLAMAAAVIFSVPVLADSEAYEVSDLNEQLVMGTLWYQTSAEMRAISYQTFNFARILFDMDLAKGDAGKQRVVVVDIGETITDCSPYEAGLVGNDFDYAVGWKEWIAEANNKALPGAVDFCRYVVSKGGDVFYITNRKAEFREGTMKNLQILGFPSVDEAHVMMREQDRSKSSRRAKVMEDHRVVLLIGDSLNDFEDEYSDKNPRERASAVDKFKVKFGSRFLLLPNPMYGDWEGSAYGFKWEYGPKDKDFLRKGVLRSWNM